MLKVPKGKTKKDFPWGWKGEAAVSVMRILFYRVQELETYATVKYAKGKLKKGNRQKSHRGDGTSRCLPPDDSVLVTLDQYAWTASPGIAGTWDLRMPRCRSLAYHRRRAALSRIISKAEDGSTVNSVCISLSKTAGGACGLGTHQCFLQELPFPPAAWCDTNQ